MDSTIHWINRYPADTAIGFPNTYSLVIYPMDSAIQRLDNPGQLFEVWIAITGSIPEIGSILRVLK